MSDKLRADIGLLVLRLAMGGFMLTHGVPKLLKLLSGNTGFADPLGIGEAPSLVLAVFAEALCSVAIALGLLTRLATVPLIITMLVAALIVHGDDPLSKKEMALLYLSGYVTLALTGAGAYSLDAKVIKGKLKRFV